jgi:PAS domain S-box-containing protein
VSKVVLRPGYLRGVARFLTRAREGEYQEDRDELLLFTRAQFRDAFDGVAIGVTLITMQGRILDVNPALERILNTPAAELRGKCVTELTHPEDLPVARRLLWQLLAGDLDHYRLRKRYLQSDGSTGEAFVTVALVRDRTGQPRHLLGLLDDLTRSALQPDGPRPASGLVRDPRGGATRGKASKPRMRD